MIPAPHHAADRWYAAGCPMPPAPRISERHRIAADVSVWQGSLARAEQRRDALLEVVARPCPDDWFLRFGWQQAHRSLALRIHDVERCRCGLRAAKRRLDELDARDAAAAMGAAAE